MENTNENQKVTSGASLTQVPQDCVVYEKLKELVRLRLVEGWGGCLRLEYNKEDGSLHIIQYESSSTYSRDLYTLYTLDDRSGWSDFLFDCGVADYGDRLLLDRNQWDDWKSFGVIKGDKIIVTDLQRFFEDLDWSEILYDSLERAIARLYEVTGCVEV